MGKNHTAESWFKVGNAAAIADILVAKGWARPCRLIVSATRGEGTNIEADDYDTWPERATALEKALLIK